MNEKDELILITQKMERCIGIIADVAKRGKTDTEIVRRQYGQIAALLGDMAKLIFR